MKKLSLALLLSALPLAAQTGPAASPDSWQSLSFLEGTWDAKAQGSAGAAANGQYTFRRELANHILARHGNLANCKGPNTFDCDHNDLLYIFEDAPGQPFKAIYFDNEGHVIHYNVSTPGPNSAIFLSEPAPGPQFRLTYELKGAVMTGKFQMHMPGQSEWRSYLEWSGAKQ